MLYTRDKPLIDTYKLICKASKHKNTYGGIAMKTNVKINKFVSPLCVLIMSLLFLSNTPSAIKVSAYNLTGNQSEDIISVAEDEVGYKGESNKGNKYTYWYGKITGSDDNGYGYFWCQAFIAYCSNKAGIETSIIPRSASTQNCKDFFVNNNKWHDSYSYGGDYIPTRGDLIYFSGGRNGKGKPDHVGLVYSVSSTYVYTIEGNTSNKVAKRSYRLSNSYILGYASPNYKSNNSSISIPNGYYAICPVCAPGKVIETVGGAIFNETYNEGWAYNVATWDDYHYYDMNQTWYFEYLFTDNGEKIYRIKNGLVGQYLVMDDSNLSLEAPNVCVHEDGDSPFAWWKVQQDSEGNIMLINVSTGKALDIYGASSDNSANCCGYKYDKNDIAEKFTLNRI